MSDLVNQVINKTRKISDATIVTITHDLNSALRIADRIFVLQNGKFIWNGTPDEIFSAKSNYIQQFLDCANVGKKLEM